MDRAAVSPAESWDAFFSDFYLRAYAHDERDARAEGQALAAARLAGTPEQAATCSTPRAASAATRSRSPARATASRAPTARSR